MPEIDHLNLQLLQTIETMKQQGLVDDYFNSIRSLKENIQDHFFLEVIPGFCSDTRDVLRSLAEMIIKRDDDSWDYDQMLEYVYKIKGGAVSLLGPTSRMAEACCAFERAINMASKEECSKAMHQAQREYEAVEAKLHTCLKLERGIVILASKRNP